MTEALRHGLLDGLDPALLAGVVSAFTFEARRAATTTPHRASWWWSTGWPGWTAWPPGSGPTNGGSACGGPAAPTPVWPGR